MTDSPLYDGKSFSLTRKVPPGSPLAGSWQERAYDRLKVLYGVGKLLSTSEHIENIFPEILDFCATSFPFMTGVLIEKRGKNIVTAMGHSINASPEQIAFAASRAKEHFEFLTGHSELAAARHPLSKEITVDHENYIALPLIVDDLPAFGVLQLEGSSPLDEKDVEFVDALCNLFAIAIDRCYRIQNEQALRENFISLLSHDLRTPLSASKITAQLIQRDTDASTTIQSLAGRIVANMNRVDQMISGLLDANRIRSGESIPLNIEPFNLTASVRKTLEELSIIYGERFALNAPADIEGYWDKGSLRRIIENLCNNAIKYGSLDSPINLSICQTPDKVTIEVQNKGGLISLEDQKTIFQQFKRGQKTHGSGKKGWGIGLTLVRGVTEAHGGNVAVASSLENGTVFTVTLPLDSRPFLPKE